MIAELLNWTDEESVSSILRSMWSLAISISILIDQLSFTLEKHLTQKLNNLGAEY